MSNDFDNSRAGHVLDRLSEYLDGTLGATEQERVRLHVEGCGTCRAEYLELSATRHIMRSTPVVAPPRAFTLTPEMVAAHAPARSIGIWQRLLTRPNAPRFVTGSVL